MARLRLKLFWLLVAIAAFAGLLAFGLDRYRKVQTERLEVLSNVYRQNAVRFEEREISNSLRADFSQRLTDSRKKRYETSHQTLQTDIERLLVKKILNSQDDAARFRKRSEYAAKMKAKYLYAASRPWEPVAPDPPPP